MKITKTFIIFLTAFLMGYTSFLFISGNYKDSKEKSDNLKTQPFNSYSSSVTNQTNDADFKPEIFDLPEDLKNSEPKYKIKLLELLETGNNFRKDEVIAKSGEIWLGLFEEGNEYQLRFTKIKVKPETRPNYVWKNFVTVKSNNKTEPVFLLKNADKFKEGAVSTLFRSSSVGENSESGLLKRGFVKVLPRSCLYETKYTLSVKDGLTVSKEKVLVLVLESEEFIVVDGIRKKEVKSQIVYFNKYFESGDNLGNLLWVGDLDKDGRPDIYMNFYTYEKGSFGSSLFLSSEAEDDKLIKEVATFGTLGC